VLRRRSKDASIRTKKKKNRDNNGKEYGKTKEVEKVSRKQVDCF